MNQVKNIPDNKKLWDILIEDGIDPESDEGQDILWEAVINGFHRTYLK